MTKSDSDYFCYSILSKYPIIDVIPGLDGSVGVVGLLVGMLYFFNSGLTIYWIRHQKYSAEMGIERAARHVNRIILLSHFAINLFVMQVVFPVYVPFMWASSLSDIVVGITILLVPLDIYDTNSWSASAAVALGWALQHVVTEGVAFLLMQYGCGLEAAKRSFLYATLWVSPSHLSRFSMLSLPYLRNFNLTHPSLAGRGDILVQPGLPARREQRMGRYPPRDVVASNACVLRHDMACTRDLPVQEARTSRLFPLLDYLSGDRSRGLIASLCKQFKQCGPMLLLLWTTAYLYYL